MKKLITSICAVVLTATLFAQTENNGANATTQGNDIYFGTILERSVTNIDSAHEKPETTAYPQGSGEEVKQSMHYGSDMFASGHQIRYTIQDDHSGAVYTGSYPKSWDYPAMAVGTKVTYIKTDQMNQAIIQNIR